MNLLLLKRAASGIILLIAFQAFAFAQEANAPMAVFFQANAAYKDGEYSKAIRLYQSILDRGYESGAIYYNMGNCFFKNKRLGEAVLYYLRAKRLMPRDDQLAYNLRYARSFVPQYAGESPGSFWRQRWTSYKSRFTVNELSWMLYGCFLLMAFSYILFLVRRWPVVRLAVVMALWAAVFLFHLWVLTAKVGDYGVQAVVMEKAHSRYEPIEQATKYYALSEGTVVRILKKEGDWLKIRRSDGKIGWIEKRKLQVI